MIVCKLWISKNHGKLCLSCPAQEKAHTNPTPHTSAAAAHQNRAEWTGVEPQIALARQHAKSQYVNYLETILPSSLMKIECANEGWVEIIMTVDSGATESVMGPHHAPNVPTVEGFALTAGVLYEVANGTKIRNRGEKRMKCGRRMARSARLSVRCVTSTSACYPWLA